MLVATPGAFELMWLTGLVMGWVIATLPMVAREFLAMWNRLLPDADFRSGRQLRQRLR